MSYRREDQEVRSCNPVEHTPGRQTCIDMQALAGIRQLSASLPGPYPCFYRRQVYGIRAVYVIWGLDRGWGGGATMAGYPPLCERRGAFASSDKAEGPLSQLTISLSCEPPSAAGARLQRPGSAEQPDRVPRQQ